MAKRKQTMRERIMGLEAQIAELPAFATEDSGAWETCKKQDSATPTKNTPALADRWARLVQARLDDGLPIEKLVDACLCEANYGKLPDERRREQLYRLLQRYWGHDAGFRAVLKWRYSSSPVWG